MPTPSFQSYRAQLPAFRSGEDNPRDFLERCLARLDAWEGSLHAFVSTNIPGARAAADRSTERWKAGKPLSPVDGMPVGIKDIYETADMPTGQGSPLFTGWQSVRDAAAVAALREAGAVVVGKTVTTEFAATEPGPTTNPWDVTRTPGGSSSGSAATVAAGILPAALGTQVIGSIMRPASYCGCYGYKPTVGSINRGGSFDHLSQSAAGVLAATLEEAWVTMREISTRAGGDPGHPGLSGSREGPPSRKPRTVTLLETAGLATASPHAVAALEAAKERLERNGITVLTRAKSDAVEAAEGAIHDAGFLSRRINAWESRWPLNTYSRDMDHNGLSVAMQKRLAEGESMTLEEFQGLLVKRAESRATYARLAAVSDVCVTLSASSAAPVGLAFTGDPTFAVPGSLLGVPALSLPLLQAEGLPLGLQVLGFYGADEDMFAFAGAIRDLWATERA